MTNTEFASAFVRLWCEFLMKTKPTNDSGKTIQKFVDYMMVTYKVFG